MKEKPIKIIYHYCKEDPDCCEDHSAVEVFVDGKLKVSLQDYYHDNSDYAHGYIKAILEERGYEDTSWCGENVEYVQIADYEY